MMVTGTLRTLLLLTSSMLRLQNISFDFWIALEESEQPPPAEGDGAVANTAEVVEVDEAEVVVVVAGSNSNV